MSTSRLIGRLIENLRCLPGVGPKSAQRMAFHLLEHNRDGGRQLAEALSLAMEQDRTVILIDADPSRSAVANLFGIKVETGLIEALSRDDADPSDVLLETDIAGLSIIPAGKKVSLSPELFSSARAERFLAKLLADHPNAILLLDAPPVLATGEPSALARHMGQVILVVEAGRTGKPAIAEALDLVGICPSISFVLNKTQFQFGSIRFGKYYSYYYNQQRKSAASGR